MHYEESYHDEHALMQFIQTTPATFFPAQSEIKKLQQKILSGHEDSLQAAAAGLQKKWLLIPPRAVYFEGPWETVVKSVRKHLRRTMCNNVLNFEELSTLFCQAENVLNSEPIGTISEDPNGETPITPADLCSGEGLGIISSRIGSTPPYLDNCSPEKRWTFIQSLLCGFWKRWPKTRCRLSKSEENRLQKEQICSAALCPSLMTMPQYCSGQLGAVSLYTVDPINLLGW